MFIKLPESMDSNTRGDMRMYLNNLEGDRKLYENSHSSSSSSNMSHTDIDISGLSPKGKLVAGLILTDGFLLMVKMLLPFLLL